MSEHHRRRFYCGDDGTVYITLEREKEVVVLDTLLPESLRGKSYEEVTRCREIGQFFQLADMLLISAEAMQAHVKGLAISGTTKDNPVETNLPPFRPSDLGLRNHEGLLDPQKLTEALSIVAAYWNDPDFLGIKSGYIAAALRRGMTAKDILKFIRANTQKHPKTGEPELVMPKFTPEEELITALIPPDISIPALSKARVEALFAWLSSVPSTAKDFSNPRRKVADIAFLGIANFSGVMDRQAANAARDYIWERIEEPPDFKALWRHIQTRLGNFPPDDPSADHSAYNARVAELYDQKATNTAIAAAVVELAKSGAAVPTDHLCYAVWMQWQLGRAGQLKPELSKIFNQQPANWLAADAANDLLGEVFPVPETAHMPAGRKVGRNEPCPCGSGQKYKKCCGR